MEKSILVRRKAQKLAREGRTGEAIEHLTQLKSETDVDPYDHVFIGDLLLRQGHRDEAIEAFLEAVDSYQKVGLNRSAIAICKKILRLGDPPVSVSRTLGDLYLSEGLHTEAVQHLLRYLDGIPADTSPPEEFYEALDKMASLSGLQVETALRLSEHFQRVRREDRAAEVLERLADKAGTPDLAQELRERARQLCSAYRSRATPAGNGEDSPGSVGQGNETVDANQDSPEGTEGAVEASPEPFGEVLEAGDSLTGEEEQPSEPESSCVPTGGVTLDISLGELIEQACSDDPAGWSGGGSDAGALDNGGVGATDPDTGDTQAPENTPERAASTGALVTGGFEVEHFPAPSTGNSGPGAASDDDSAGDAILDLDEDEESRQRLVEQAASAFEAEDWNQARACYERLHLGDPLDRDVLGSLLAVVQQMEDRPGEVRCLIQLGDAWIAEEEYEKALEVFLAVVRLDPENATGRRRLLRFREMGVKGAGDVPGEENRGSEIPAGAEPPAGEAMPGVLETGSASVTVSSEPGRPSEEWVDLGALLDEFKSGVQNQIDGDDFQSHYDLAVSHRTMGLHNEAIEEIDSMLGNDKLPGSMAWICRELRGECLADLGRHADAVEEFRRMLDLPVDDEHKRWSVLYNLARVMESAGEWREAEETYKRLIAEAPGFLDADQRHRQCRERCDPDSRAA